MDVFLSKLGVAVLKNNLCIHDAHYLGNDKIFRKTKLIQRSGKSLKQKDANYEITMKYMQK